MSQPKENVRWPQVPLLHIAISVSDKEKTAKFYEETFGFKRVSESVVATRLTDGVINLTFLQFRNQDDAGDERERFSLGYITSAYGWMISRDTPGDRSERRQVSPRSSGTPPANAEHKLGIERHRLRYLNAWMGRREAVIVSGWSFGGNNPLAAAMDAERIMLARKTAFSLCAFLAASIQADWCGPSRCLRSGRMRNALATRHRQSHPC